MKHAVSNCNGKIWLFWNMDIDYVILEEDEQQITCDIGHNELQNHFTTTFVYAKCKDHLRRPLWDKMLYYSAEIDKPWCSVGDYNAITSIEEKLGGVPYNMRKNDHIRYFKFLNCWTDQPNFLDIVKACWERTVEGNNMWKFHQKLKRLSNTLSTLSRKEFGDIFTEVKEYEEKVKTTGEQLIQDHSETNRTILHEINAKYIRFLEIEDSILKQKTQLQWFKEGDCCNVPYFCIY
ncbi:hypothetical protein H5410_050877 [Solanum commersonii]|uniref:Uncharacterized protein n=1 Tax=Solanum commersonii TaxID=4109 RepID=A0A9J5WWU0_SOLCO|nr:hypothetical protein H5410_050877 [Solanum commersonii]